MLAVAALGLSLTTVVLQLPYAVMDTWIFGLTIPMPTLLGGPFSESGLAQAAFCAIGWLVAVAAPGAIVLRLGGGALRKQPYLRHLSELRRNRKAIRNSRRIDSKASLVWCPA